MKWSVKRRQTRELFSGFLCDHSRKTEVRQRGCGLSKKGGFEPALQFETR